MKVLKNNYNITETTTPTMQYEPYPRKLNCENCGSELEYEKSDLRMGEYGCMYIDCPLCGCDNMLEDNEESITLTVDNIEFPIHFHHVSKETGAVDCCNTEMVREYIGKAVDYFRTNKEECNWGGWVTGNFYIHVRRYSGDENYEVTISNDFYHMDIPFDKKDY